MEGEVVTRVVMAVLMSSTFVTTVAIGKQKAAAMIVAVLQVPSEDSYATVNRCSGCVIAK